MSDIIYSQSNPMPPLKEIVEKQERRKSVINFTTEVFENAELAEDWLKSPNPALGGKIPNDLLDTK